MSSALEMRHVSKRFDSVVALDDASITVRPGTVHALLGENGAGKTTLMRVAFGLESADTGEIRVSGQTLRGRSVEEASRAGLGMVHQHFSLVPNLTAAENAFLGRHGLYRPRQANDSLSKLAQDAGLPVAPQSLVRDLNIVEQQRLEIVKALASGARVLILDEPTSVLAPSEVAELFAWVRRFTSRGGSVVLVTHKLREALALADDLTVLRRGRVVMAAGVAGLTESQLAAAIFPDVRVVSKEQSDPTPPGDVVVDAQALSVADASGVVRVRDATIALRRGDILGIAAVGGSGHRELLLALAGLRAVTAGRLRGTSSVAVIPADRARDAVVADFTLAENVAIHGVGRRRGLMRWTQIAARTRTLIERFGIVAASEHARLRTLSGGNQQRLVVARELEGGVDLVIADNPTRGLDMQATAFVHEQLRAAARRGAAVVVHSSDLDEVLDLATRVAVVFQGQVREVAIDRDMIGRAMLGAA